MKTPATELLDFGVLGNGPDDPYTAPEHLRRVYGCGNDANRSTYRITCQVPPSWRYRDVARRFAQMGFTDFSFGYSAAAWRGLLD